LRRSRKPYTRPQGGHKSFSYEAFESVVMDVGRNRNNSPPTSVEAEGGEEEVLTLNMILWGRDVYPVDDTEGSDREANKDD